MSSLWRWRSWVLVLLLVGPVLAYVGLGMLWLWERGWVACTVAAVVWLLAGGIFSILAARWTKTARPILPPLDWESPHLFSPLDRDAWKLVQEEAEKGESLAYDALLGSDTYIDTGRGLFRRLAGHYHPFATEPLDDVPLVELMTALELAAEDLAGLCRQVPGGDLISLSHWRRAVQVAGYINRANDLYSFVLPVSEPGDRAHAAGHAGMDRQAGVEVDAAERPALVLPGLRQPARNAPDRALERSTRDRRPSLSTAHQAPAHGLERCSGRRAQTAGDRCCRRQGAGKSRLIAMIKEACSGQMSLIKAKVAPLGIEPSLIDRLKEARFVEAPGYPAASAAESRRTRAQRAAGLAAAAECDLFVLVINGCNRTTRTTWRLPRPGTAGSRSTPSTRSRPRSSLSPASIGLISAAAENGRRWDGH